MLFCTLWIYLKSQRKPADWNICYRWKTERQNSACSFCLYFGKLALWNNLVIRLWNYKNYFRIKYGPYQPSPQNQLSLDHYRLWFSAKKNPKQANNFKAKPALNTGVHMFSDEAGPESPLCHHCKTHTHLYSISHFQCRDINIYQIWWTWGESGPWNETHHNTLSATLFSTGVRTRPDPQHHRYCCLKKPCAFHSLYLWGRIDSMVPSCPSLRMKLSSSKSDCWMILPELAPIQPPWGTLLKGALIPAEINVRIKDNYR